MKMTNQGLAALTALAFDQAQTTMATGVVKCPDQTILATHHKGPLAKQIDAQLVAGFTDIVEVAHHMPVIEEHPLGLHRKQPLPAVGPGR